MSEVEKIKAEIRRDGTRRMHGHELHDLIDRTAAATVRDLWGCSKEADAFRALLSGGVQVNYVPINASDQCSPLIFDLAGPFGRPVNDDRAD